MSYHNHDYEENGNLIHFGTAYTDDDSECWLFTYMPDEGFIKAKAISISMIDGKRVTAEKFSGVPICVHPSDVTEAFLKISNDDDQDQKNFKEGLKIFFRHFMDAEKKAKQQQVEKEKRELEQRLEIEQAGKWSIKIARYFGYSETTLALLKAPGGQHFLVRSAGYPYGNPAYDKSVLNWVYMHPSRGRLHWNDFLNEVAQGKNDIESMARRLNALGFIACSTGSFAEEFEDRAEDERFLTREEIAEKYIESNTNKPSLMRRFARAAMGKKGALTLEEFNRVDVNREQWYEAEQRPRGTKDSFLSKQEAMDLIKQVCEDFGVPKVRKVKFCYPPKPSFWKRAPKPSRVDGLYKPETREISLRYHKHEDGFSKHTVLHELAHHLDRFFVHGGEVPSAAHGMRFKRIHMHLMHHYDDVPVENILGNSAIKTAYGVSFPLTEEDILSRDFIERRTVDILPVPPKVQDRAAEIYERLLREYTNSCLRDGIDPPLIHPAGIWIPENRPSHRAFKFF